MNMSVLVFVCGLILLSSVTTIASSAPDQGIVKFTRLYTSSTGETKLQDCTVQAMEKKLLPGGETPQFVRDLGNFSTGVILTQMSGDNPWHQCPTSQFVVVLEGSWFVNTTDNGYIEMGPGSILYQDDYKGLEVNGVKPMHYSGSLNDKPCNQIIISAANQETMIGDTSCDWVDQFV